MTFNTQEKIEVILACAPLVPQRVEGISIAELFSDVERVIFFDEFHFLLHNPGLICSHPRINCS